MDIKASSVSARIIVLTFIVLSIVLVQNEVTVRDREYSAAGLPLWRGEWRDVPLEYRVFLKIRGNLSKEEYPVPYFGPSLPAGEEQHPIYTDVYILERSGVGHLPEKVYLWGDPKIVFVLAYSGGNWVLGDRLISEWAQALQEEKTVEVEGYAFDMLVDGRRSTFFEVKKVVDFKFSPQVSMFNEILASGNAGGMVSGSSIPVLLPVDFQVGRIFRGSVWTDKYYIYIRWMNSGECIAFSINASKPIKFEMYYSNCTYPDDWSREEIITSRTSLQMFNWEFTAYRDGFYVYTFEAEGQNANITFEGKMVTSPSCSLLLKTLIDSRNFELSNPNGIDTSHYNLSAYEAVQVALENYSITRFVHVHVRPSQRCTLENGTKISGDYWLVDGYHNPPEKRSGTITSIIVDKNGKIIDKNLIAWATS